MTAGDQWFAPSVPVLSRRAHCSAKAFSAALKVASKASMRWYGGADQIGHAAHRVRLTGAPLQDRPRSVHLQPARLAPGWGNSGEVARHRRLGHPLTDGVTLGLASVRRRFQHQCWVRARCARPSAGSVR